MLRQTCRHLARFTGADTVSVHVLDARHTQLIPTAAYRVPARPCPSWLARLLADA